VRLLLDESLSARVAPLLSKAGHGVLHAADVDLLGEPDDVVLLAAAAERRTLVTADTDFGALLALSRAPTPSVLLLRRGGRRIEQRAQQILIALENAAGALESGALVVAQHDFLRIRELPIEPDR
jgi:predicted nuclease of predicted toxin-antitoxin system